MSILYKRSKNGYGVIILPKERICLSDCKSEFGEDLFDIDLGAIGDKHSVSYIDMDGNHAKRDESVRYIERYVDFTQNAYMLGKSSGNAAYLGVLYQRVARYGYHGLNKNDDYLADPGCMQRMVTRHIFDNPVRFKSADGRALLCLYKALSDGDCLTDTSFSTSKAIDVFNERLTRFKDAVMDLDVYTDTDKTTTLHDEVLRYAMSGSYNKRAITRTNQNMFLHSYLDGYCDSIISQSLTLAHTVCDTHEQEPSLASTCKNVIASCVLGESYDAEVFDAAYAQYVGKSSTEVQREFEEKQKQLDDSSYRTHVEQVLSRPSVRVLDTPDYVTPFNSYIPDTTDEELPFH